MANSKILTAEQEKTLRQPIEEYVGKIQKEIDELRKDGTAKVIMYQGRIENVKRDKTLSKGEKDSEIAIKIITPMATGAIDWLLRIFSQMEKS